MPKTLTTRSENPMRSRMVVKKPEIADKPNSRSSLEKDNSLH